MSKICANCGKKVDDAVNFCPYCRGQSFKNEIQARSSEVLEVQKNPDLVYKLFYKEFNGNFILSKSKITAISVFLYFVIAGILSGTMAIAVSGIIIALIIYVILYAIASVLNSTPSANTLKYNDYGLITDLKNLVFYWQDDETGGYSLSKTKIISFLVFLLFAVLIFIVPDNAGKSIGLLFAASIFAGVIFEIPTFIIGFAVHKLTSNNENAKIIEKKEVKKVETKKEPVKAPVNTIKDTHKFPAHAKELNSLKSEFETKDANVRKLIEKRFEPPQITYTRFISLVDKSKILFMRQYESASEIIKMADETSPRIEAELNSKVKILKSIIDKIEDLTSELIVTMDDDHDGEVNDLMDDMENLISSIKEYEK